MSWTSSPGGLGGGSAGRAAVSRPGLKLFLVALIGCLVIVLIWQAVSMATGPGGGQAATVAPAVGGGPVGSETGSGGASGTTGNTSSDGSGGVAPDPKYTLQEGPGGLSVELPSSWQPGPARINGNLQAASPSDPDLFVRYGATAQERDSVVAYLLGGERSNPNVRSGYHRIRLRGVSYLGADQAADWEFTFTKDGVQRHVFARYWYRDGLMYVIYGSSSASRWSELRPTLAHALQTATIG